MMSNLNKNVAMNAAVSNFVDEYGLGNQVEDCSDLEDCLQDGDNDNICYLFVECTKLFFN